MLKARSGRKMNPFEAEEYFKWKHENDYKGLVSDRSCHGVPSNG